MCDPRLGQSTVEQPDIMVTGPKQYTVDSEYAHRETGVAQAIIFAALEYAVPLPPKPGILSMVISNILITTFNL